MRFIVTMGIFAAIAASWKLIPASQPTTGVLSVTNANKVPFRATSAARFVGALTLRNDGPGIVEIGEILPGCGCARIQSFPISVSPGEVAQVVFEMDPEALSRSAFQIDNVRGTLTLSTVLQISGRFRTADEDDSLRVVCSGVFEMPVLLKSEVVDLGRLSVESPKTQFAISMATRYPVDQISVYSTPTGVSAAIVDGELQLTVDPVDFLVAAGRASPVVLDVRLDDGSTVMVKVPIDLEIVPLVRSQPSLIVFRRNAQPDISVQTVRLIPDGVGVNLVKSVSVVGGDALKANTTSLRVVNDVYEFDLSVVPTDSGMINAVIALELVCDFHRKVRLDVPVIVLPQPTELVTN